MPRSGDFYSAASPSPPATSTATGGTTWWPAPPSAACSGSSTAWMVPRSCPVRRTARFYPRRQRGGRLRQQRLACGRRSSGRDRAQRRCRCSAAPTAASSPPSRRIRPAALVVSTWPPATSTATPSPTSSPARARARSRAIKIFSGLTRSRDRQLPGVRRIVPRRRVRRRGREAQTAPVFTSDDEATFEVGVAGTFDVTTSGGAGPVTLTVTGTLPPLVTFTDNGDGTGTLAGTPDPGTGRCVSADVPPPTTASIRPVDQAFTLTVNERRRSPAPTTSTFNIGVSGSFEVTSTGFPTPSLTQSRRAAHGRHLQRQRATAPVISPARRRRRASSRSRSPRPTASARMRSRTSR